MIPSMKNKLIALAGFACLLYFMSYRGRPHSSMLGKYKRKNNESPTVPSCYLLPHDKSQLPDISDYSVRPNTTFFLETSCRHAGGVSLTVRQSCAFESAAKAHPDTEILVLFPAPVSMKSPPPHVKMLLKFANLKFLHVDVGRFFQGTPIKSTDFMEMMNKSAFAPSQASDILRLAALWKYGGAALDSDFVVLKSLYTKRNYIGQETKDRFSTAALNIDKNTGIGKLVIEEMLKDVQANPDFAMKYGDQMGTEIATRVLRKICKSEHASNMTDDKCGGFHVLPAPPESPLYPTGLEWEFFTRENQDKKRFERIRKDAWAVHMLGRESVKTSIKVGSNVFYGDLAAEFCPLVRSTVKDYY